MEFNFTNVKKGRWIHGELPHSIIRLDNQYIRLSKNISDRFITSHRERTSGTESIAIAIAFDKDSKALKLIRPIIEPGYDHSRNGYWFTLTHNGATTTVPRPLLRAGLEVGDYKETEEGSNIFVLVQ